MWENVTEIVFVLVEQKLFKRRETNSLGVAILAGDNKHSQKKVEKSSEE